MKKPVLFTTVSVIAVILLISGMMIGCPQYRVYTARKNGEAILAKAQSSRLVTVTDAKAKEESAAYLKNADIKRAEGIAEANRIIGQSLKNNKSYLKWLFIDKLDMAQSQVVYLPTETGIPILEANRLQNQKQPVDTSEYEN